MLKPNKKSIAVSISVVLVLTASSFTLSGWPQSLEYVSTINMSSSYQDVFVVNNYAYVATTGGFDVLNVSNPSFPRMVGQIPNRMDEERIFEWQPNSVFVSGNYAYLTTVNELAIIDISQPEKPKVVSWFRIGGHGGRDIFVSGNYAYITCDYDRLCIKDISQPDNPKSISSMRIPAESVYVQGNYAYVVGGTDSPPVKELSIIDISNPEKPFIVGRTAGGNNLHVSGNYAYVINSTKGTLSVINISNPKTPSQISSIGVSNALGIALGIYVADDYAFVVCTSGLFVIDISNPENPKIASEMRISLDQRAKGIYVSGNYAYVGTNDEGLAIIDISQPETPKLLRTLGSVGWATDVYVSGSYAYVTVGRDLVIIDTSQPKNPIMVSSLKLAERPFEVGNVHVSDNHAFVAVAANDFVIVIIDISQPDNPREIARINTPEFARRIYVSDNYAYIAASNNLLVIDVSQPDKPMIAGELPPRKRDYGEGELPPIEGLALDVYVLGNYAYLAAKWGGLYVIDVSQPSNPKLIANIRPAGWSIYAIDGIGNYLYAVTSISTKTNRFLSVIDISNPSNPKLINRTTTEWGRNSRDIDGIYVSNKYVYIAGGELLVFDIFERENPQPARSIYNPRLQIAPEGFSGRIYVSDSYIYTTNQLKQGGFGDIAQTALLSIFSLQESDVTLEVKIERETSTDVFVAVDVSGITDLHAFQFDFVFNPNVLQAAEIANGGFLDSDGTAIFWNPTYKIDNRKGEITWISAARIGGSGVSGTGTLTQIAFKVRNTGQSKLFLKNIKLASPNGEITPFVLEGGEVNIEKMGAAKIKIIAEMKSAIVLNIELENVENLHQFSFDLGFDNQNLEVLQVTEGSFLKKDGGDTVWQSPQIAAGRISGIHSARIDNKGIDGSGVLATITFRVWDGGQFEFNIDNITLMNPTKDFIFFSGDRFTTIKVASSRAWDINKDYTVDISDLVLVAIHFQEKISKNARPNPDVNQDGIVDLLDFVLICTHLGEQYSMDVAAAPTKGR